MDNWQVRTVYEPAKWLDEHCGGWQFGESGYLAALAERLGVNQAIEIGAGDGGQDLPLTLLPLYQKGIPAILFEQDELRQQALKQVYPLADVRGKYNFPPLTTNRFAGVVVDVDSIDLDIAGDVAFKMRPAFICVEHFDAAFSPSTLGDIPEWLWGKRLEQGGFVLQATIGQILDRLGGEICDYAIIALSRVNSIYVRRDLLPALEG
jgi:hypothetical protein